MTTPFPTWDARVRTARDERTRRTLLGEVGLWRARRLTDLPAQREATWALSELHRLLGEPERAAHEAQQLLALCRTAPRPPREVLTEAERQLARLSRPERGGGDRNEALDGAIEAAHAGRWAEARDALGKSRHPKAGLLRIWTRLGEALASEEPARTEALVALERDLAGRFSATPASGREPEPATRAAAPAVASAPADSPLALLLDGPVPRRREALLRALDAALEQDPSRADAIAAAALRDHVEHHGAKAVAPWLIGYAVRALGTSEGSLTRAALASLGDAYAVTAYAEPAFELLAQVWRGAQELGLQPHGARRGLLRQGEPEDRRAWTLRVQAREGEALVAVFPAAHTPWAPRMVDTVVARLRELSPRGGVLAPGAHHAPLREAAGAAGLLAGEDDVRALLEAVASQPPPPPPPAPEPPPPDPGEVLRALFVADPPSDEAAYAAPLGELRRAFRAFVAIREPLHALPVDEADARFAPYLRAVHASAPPTVRLVEATSEAVRLAALAPGGAVEALLRGGDELAARYGAPDVLPLLGVLAPLVAEGWTIGRVLLGLTRGEERTRPALAPLGKAVRGLTRVRVGRGDVQGEVWWLDAPTPEAQMALPLLLLESAARVVVAQAGQGTEAWLPADGDRPLVLWSGAEGPVLTERAAAWPASAPVTEEEAEGDPA